MTDAPLTANSVAARYWSKVAIAGPDECWRWGAGKTGENYGAFHPSKGENVGAHVFAYVLTNGDIPAGAWVDHTCHNGTGCPGGRACGHRLCCNPRHLEAVEPNENTRRSHRSRGAQEVCPNGHRYTEQTTRLMPDKGISGWRICVLCEKARRRPARPRPLIQCRECQRHRQAAAHGLCSACYVRGRRAQQEAR